ncbi:hypothetical protein SEVIR_9G246700v4 [Setaria viridis]|uniref:Uncharacterized protein n=2 Tax=Setaria TaxID=4554 RepID=A0A368SK82_SETIT|nr:hypothetical protein SETIT_9G247400v2 [Setaria italica]TKV93755.1 hypothetical protein SEVIR_9G246700v2 [Setaria viridis]
MWTDPEPDPDSAYTTYSTVVGTTLRGAHVLNVDCYAATKGLVPAGSHISSSSSTAGRHSSWHSPTSPTGTVRSELPTTTSPSTSSSTARPPAPRWPPISP